MPVHSRQSLTRAVARFAKKTQGPVRLADFCRAHDIPYNTIYSLFPRGIGELLAAAGLQDRCCRIGRVTKEDLLAEIDIIVRDLGRMPTRMQLHRKARFSPSSFGRFLGTWKELNATYRKWKSSPSLREGAGGRVHKRAKNRPPSTHLTASSHHKQSARPAPGTLFGAPLGFRGLLHAPTTESGVIHLFGLLSHELGFAIEDIGAAYPDCRALRPDKHKPTRWRRIAIEFEHTSSNFKAHLHDPAKCDLIVCWQHDWPDCPLEVLELKSVLERLTDKCS